MMKKIVILSHFILLLSACDTLDVAPTDLIPTEEAIATEKGLQAALTGVYDGLQNGDIAEAYVVFGDLAADNLTAIGSRITYREVYNNRITRSNDRIDGIWNAHYDVINRANNVLAELDNVVGISETTRNTYRGQLLFIRALCHFNLVRAFGPVPVKTIPTTGISPEEINVPRLSMDQVYIQINADLTQAALDLAGTGKGQPSLVSEGAVLALQARVSLFTNQFDDVLTFTDRVMALGYSLSDSADYPSLFDEGSESPELIFQIDFSDDDVNSLADYFQPSARYEVGLTSSAYSLFSEQDSRKGMSAQASGSDLYCNKYRDFTTDSDNSIVLRYADILLMRAEALNEKSFQSDGEAFDLLNAIRYRARIDSVSGASTPTQQAFRQAIELERRREFLGEGHRWFDLIRTGRALAVLGGLKGITSANALRYPIPQSELDTNKHPEMTQNDGY